MEITEIRVKFSNREGDRLRAYCSVTFDGVFVVRDVRVVEGTNGLFVAMPSRKLSTACGRCQHKNPSLAHFCSECGAKLPTPQVVNDAGGRNKLHRDVAHPITPAFRQTLHQRIIEAYEAECERAADPNYQPKSADVEEGEDESVMAEAPVVETPYEEPAEVVSDYDALIADLRKRTGDAHERQERTRPVPPPQRAPQRPSGDRPSAPKPPRGRPAAPQRAESAPPRREAPPARSPVRDREPRREAAPRREPVERMAAEVPAWGSLEEPEPVAIPQVPAPKARTVDRPAPPPPRPAPQVATVVNEDGDYSPFGAGV